VPSSLNAAAPATDSVSANNGTNDTDPPWDTTPFGLGPLGLGPLFPAATWGPHRGTAWLNAGAAAAAGPIEASLPEASAAWAFIGAAQPAPAAVSAGGTLTTPNPQGDSSAVALAVPQADSLYLAATGFTLDGAGLRIGILSDSFNFNGNEATAIADGFLPPSGQIDIVKEGPLGATDEGQAMAELIYQIAPGATIYFYTADDSEADFAAGINTLVADGVSAIVDDVEYKDEPFYQNTGLITEAVENAVTHGVDYFAAAGNEDADYYEQVFTPTTTTLPGISGALMVDAVSGTSPYEAINLDSHRPLLDFTLEWTEPFGASRYDIGVALYSNNGSGYKLVQNFTTVDLGGNPVLSVDTTVDVDAGNYYLAFYENASQTVDGSPVNPGTFKIIFFEDSDASIDGVGAGVGSGTSIGHQLVPGANTVGAVDSKFTPANGVSPPVPENFSSSGPGVTYINADGQTLAQPQTIDTPEFAATDDTDTTVFGDFFGTSAAAPNAAAVGLLMLQADPRLTTVQVTFLLERSAIPTDDPAQAGAGLIQADTAVAAALTAATTPIWTDQDSSGFWSDPLNWSDALVPSGTSDVSITDGDGIFAGAYVVTEDDPTDTVAALMIDGGSFTAADPALDVLSNTRLGTGALTLGRGAITLGGTLLDSGALLGGSTTGTIDIAGGLLSVGGIADAVDIRFGTAGGEVVLAAVDTFAADAAIDASIGDFVAGDTIDLPNLAGTLVAAVHVIGNAVTLVDSADDTLAALTVSGSFAGLAHSTDALGGTALIVACYAAGTAIATVAGSVPVQHLRAGDRVLTADGAPLPVIWIGHRRIDCRLHPEPELVRPVRIATGALGPGVPGRDLLVSPDHGVRVDGALIPARLLLNHRSITQAPDAGVVTYYHVELARHALLLAEGAAAESYLDTGNRAIFANAPPIGSQVGAAGLALTTAPEAVFPVWRRLARRAGVPTAGMRALPSAQAGVAAGLALLAGARRLAPIWSADGAASFALPRRTGALRLVCAATRPSRQSPWLDDRRRLGVAVRALRVDGEALPLDGPALGDGWWPIERPARPFRWTDGNAALRVPAGGAVLSLRLVA
jgi:hypothetical protein